MKSMIKSANKAECLSESDRILLNAATQQQMEANATYAFVSTHLAVIYKLGDGDHVEVNSGLIFRAEVRSE